VSAKVRVKAGLASLGDDGSGGSGSGIRHREPCDQVRFGEDRKGKMKKRMGDDW
jgi:hypothetical protein